MAEIRDISDKIIIKLRLVIVKLGLVEIKAPATSLFDYVSPFI
jgi:hypothetical protein